jgi:regulator of sirC expression with transglutaminase-like and TPR domain
MDPTVRWRELLARSEQDLALDEAALLIAAHARADLDIAEELRRLDRLADGVDGEDADAVSELLFVRLGFAGNSRGYDDPNNSYLDQVVQRRLGIPISLSVLFIEVGRRCGMDLEGIGLPGHYVVRDRRNPDTLIDVFGSGRRLDEAACRRLLGGTLGPDAAVHPASFAPSGHRATLARMLNNLDRSFRHRRDAGALTWVTNLRITIPDQPVSVLVGAAETLADLGRYDEAAALLDDLAGRSELSGEAARRVRRRAVATRARLN